MAVWWPSPTDSNRVDLLTATYSQVYGAVRAEHPTWTQFIVADTAQGLWEQAQQLRAASALVTAVGPAIGSIVGSVSSGIRDNTAGIISNVGGFLNLVTQEVAEANRKALLNAQTTQKSLIDQVGANIGGFIGGAGDAIGGLIDTATGGIGSLLSSAGSTIGSVVNTVKGGASSLISAGSSALAGLIGTVQDTIGGFLDGAGQALGDLVGTVADGVGGFLAGAGDVIGDIASGVRGFIGDLIANVQTGIGGIVNRLISIPGALVDMAGQVGEAVTDLGGLIVGGLGDFLLGPLADVLEAFSKDKEAAMSDVITATVDRALANPSLPDEHRPLLASLRTPTHPIWMVLLVFALPIIAGQVIGTLTAPALAPAVQGELKAIRPTPLGLGDAVQSYFRGDLDRGGLDDQGGRSGYAVDIDRAIELGRPRPTPIELALWMHRELIAPGDMVERLQALGYAPADATNLVEASAVLPGVSDLVRMAVREAFPGQVAFDGVRGQGVPSRFVELTQQQGLDPELARSYWAAHWELPSVSAAFSMYHRGLVTEAQLRGLLKEQDMAPEWVDRMIAVAYDPLTRVDVRRMYELGVLSAAEVEAAYRDLGYSPENAGRLRRFVVADAAASAAAAASSERDLTRADLVGAYADGILNRAQVSTQLQAIGFDDTEADLILDREDIRAMRAERKETRGAIVDQVVAQVIDQVTAQDKLNAAGYTADEVAATLREIDRKLAAQVKQPTKAELDRFRKLKLIDDLDYADELRRLGYAERWVGLFVAAGSAQEDAGG